MNIKIALLFSAVSIAAFAQQESGKIRLLTPKADSPTAMRKCGADLEKVKTDDGLTVHYVFTGNEVLNNMQYCVAEAGEVHVAHTSYKVPAGTIGWMNSAGTEVVLEECINKAECQGCSVPEVAAAPPPQPEAPPPLPPVVERPPVEVPPPVNLIPARDYVVHGYEYTEYQLTPEQESWLRKHWKGLLIGGLVTACVVTVSLSAAGIPAPLCGWFIRNHTLVHVVLSKPPAPQPIPITPFDPK